jgi:hypothetical protein
LFVNDSAPSGSFLGVYYGEVYDAANRGVSQKSYTVKMDARTIGGRHWGVYYVDAAKYGSTARFVNHSCSPSAMFSVWDVLGKPTVVVVATGLLQRGEEVTVDYGDEYGMMKCCCGANNCVSTKAASIVNCCKVVNGGSGISLSFDHAEELASSSADAYSFGTGLPFGDLDGREQCA